MSAGVGGAVVAYLEERAKDPEVVAACSRAAHQAGMPAYYGEAKVVLAEFLRIVGDES